MLFDINNRYPRAYIHRHKLTANHRPKGFNSEGPAEMVQMVSQIDRLLVQDNYNEVEMMKDGPGALHEYKMKPIYTQKPHITADNYFSGDNVMDYLGERGYGMTCTCRRDRLPSQMKSYLHHEKVNSADSKVKVMRFQKPIVAIKQVPAGEDTLAYTKTLVSFQSTGPTNITGVNNLKSCELYVSKKDRGRKDNKYVWAIEQNEARETYLGHYFGIDITDHMIKNSQMKFTSWRYWHSPYLHALSIGVLAAYDMYNECCDGDLVSDWKIEKRKRMSFAVFRQTLSQQMLEYNPANVKYMGDELTRIVTQVNQKKRRLKSDACSRKMVQYDEGGMNVQNYRKAMSSERFSHGNDLNKLTAHLGKVQKKSNKMSCEVCGEATYWKCLVCNSAICVTDGKRKWSGGKCMFTYHNPSFWGLARGDSELHNMSEAAWIPPKEQQRKRNEDRVAGLKDASLLGNTN